MNSTLIKALVGLIPVGMLFVGSSAIFLRRRTTASLLQLVGTACLIVVILAHVSEALQILPAMGWGLENSAGHYLDLLSAIVFALWPATIAKADDQQLVQDYLQGRGITGAVVRPVTDDFVGRTFPNLSFFGVIFRQYPIATGAGFEMRESFLFPKQPS